MAEIWAFISANYLQILDILAVSVLFYYLFVYVRGTKTALVIQGIVILALAYFICTALRLITLVFILEKVLVVGPLALFIIFAPEIRQVLERAGKSSRLFNQLLARKDGAVPHSAIDVVTSTAYELARARVGGLFVIECNEPVDDHIVPGTELNAIASERFLVSLFNKHNPLHDGAVIIKDDRIHSAGSFLPISENTHLPRDVGTRHRAAVGLTERCDAVVVIVSEERGDVSIAYNGRLAKGLNEEQFTEQLDALVEPNPNFASIIPKAVAI